MSKHNIYYHSLLSEYRLKIVKKCCRWNLMWPMGQLRSVIVLKCSSVTLDLDLENPGPCPINNLCSWMWSKKDKIDNFLRQFETRHFTSLNGQTAWWCLRSSEGSFSMQPRPKNLHFKGNKSRTFSAAKLRLLPSFDLQTGQFWSFHRQESHIRCPLWHWKNGP